MPRAVQRQVHVDDGDQVVVHDDCPADWSNSKGGVLLIHGLAGSHRSPGLKRLTRRFLERGIRVFRLDLRGCGAGKHLAQQPYHAGRSADVAHVVEQIGQWCQEPVAAGAAAPSGADVAPRLIAIGKSLGGNILLKYLGELGAARPPHLLGAIAVNPPIDLACSVKSLQHPMNRVYDRYFVKLLCEQWQHYLGPPNEPRPKRMIDFDDRVTAPLAGYANAAEYYLACSAASFLPLIATPTWIVTARNDPLVPVRMFLERQQEWPSVVQLKVAEGGGHLGYINRLGFDPDRYWIDWRILDLVSSRFAAMDRPQSPQ
jgi:uncharacterized protein